MTPPTNEETGARKGSATAWGTLAGLLLLWNGLTALYASPFTLTERFDGAQYQLLARNRLNGHTEIGDTTHSVQSEGRHPMWRPGLVWIEQGLGALLGSVRAGAALASALGTTLLELATLWLAVCCFGTGTAVVVLVALLAPWWLAGPFLGLAIGQGPEPWAAAALVLGLAGLSAALRRSSWTWALAAGAAAGAAEWFRSGTVLLFAAPCAVHGLAYLCRRQRRRLGLSVTALAGLLLMAAWAGRGPSAVNKTVANLGGNLAETAGPFLTEDLPGLGRVSFSMGGYRLAPGGTETCTDALVRQARGASGRDFVAEHAQTIAALYFERLGEVVSGPAWGLRWLCGEAVLLCFVFQVLLSLVRRDGPAVATLAIAAGVLAYYFGPVVLLRGDQPTHYLLVVLPLILVVAGRGAATLIEWAWTACRTQLPALAEWLHCRRRPALVLLAALLLCSSGNFYVTVLAALRDYHDQADKEQAALDALHLEGKTVACRNMAWFVDRDVQTLQLPYATVAELERYVRARGADGVLVWEGETHTYFRATPYGSFKALRRALRKSPVFDTPQVSGAWRWYAVRRTQSVKG